MTDNSLFVRNIGTCAIMDLHEAMLLHVMRRLNGDDIQDEMWLVRYSDALLTYSRGVLNAQLPDTVSNIPVKWVDTGGGPTYMGPGQLGVVILVDYPYRDLTRKQLSSRVQDALLNFFKGMGIAVTSNRKSPGADVDGKRIGFIAVNCETDVSYAGFSVNIDNDLAPYRHVVPCGVPGLQVTRMIDQLAGPVDAAVLDETMIQSVTQAFGYDRSVMLQNPREVFSVTREALLAKGYSCFLPRDISA